jgi:LmbE family N-acetylglucosaminyl deacetylase
MASAVVIVAHPDDETLWSGGLMLARPNWDWFVLSLCRGSDADRAPRFRRALDRLGARGTIADLDDGPDQTPLAAEVVQSTIRRHLPRRTADLLFTHGPRGEYTRHRRHEETCRAVVQLWVEGAIDAKSLWMFAFEDGGRAHLPRAVPEADWVEQLPEQLWQAKYELVTGVYGFAPESWEARATPRSEAFWCYDRPRDALAWVQQNGVEE